MSSTTRFPSHVPIYSPPLPGKKLRLRHCSLAEHLCLYTDTAELLNVDNMSSYCQPANKWCPCTRLVVIKSSIEHQLIIWEGSELWPLTFMFYNATRKLPTVRQTQCAEPDEWMIVYDRLARSCGWRHWDNDLPPTEWQRWPFVGLSKRCFNSGRCSSSYTKSVYRSPWKYQNNNLIALWNSTKSTTYCAKKSWILIHTVRLTN